MKKQNSFYNDVIGGDCGGTRQFFCGSTRQLFSTKVKSEAITDLNAANKASG